MQRISVLKISIIAVLFACGSIAHKIIDNPNKYGNIVFGGVIILFLIILFNYFIYIRSKEKIIRLNVTFSISFIIGCLIFSDGNDYVDYYLIILIVYYLFCMLIINITFLKKVLDYLTNIKLKENFISLTKIFKKDEIDEDIQRLKKEIELKKLKKQLKELDDD